MGRCVYSAWAVCGGACFLCGVLQQAVPHRNALYCTVLQQAAPHCNAFYCTAPHCSFSRVKRGREDNSLRSQQAGIMFLHPAYYCQELWSASHKQRCAVAAVHRAPLSHIMWDDCWWQCGEVRPGCCDGSARASIMCVVPPPQVCQRCRRAVAGKARRPKLKASAAPRCGRKPRAARQRWHRRGRGHFWPPWPGGCCCCRRP